MEISCTIAWDCCDIPMVLLCDSCGGCWGIPGVLSGDHCGTTLALLWECFGIAAILPWDCFENTWIAVVTRLLWKSIEEVVRQFH